MLNFTCIGAVHKLGLEGGLVGCPPTLNTRDAI